MIHSVPSSLGPPFTLPSHRNVTGMNQGRGSKDQTAHITPVFLVGRRQFEPLSHLACTQWGEVILCKGKQDAARKGGIEGLKVNIHAGSLASQKCP